MMEKLKSRGLDVVNKILFSLPLIVIVNVRNQYFVQQVIKYLDNYYFV